MSTQTTYRVEGIVGKYFEVHCGFLPMDADNVYIAQVTLSRITSTTDDEARNQFQATGVWPESQVQTLSVSSCIIPTMSDAREYRVSESDYLAFYQEMLDDQHECVDEYESLEEYFTEDPEAYSCESVFAPYFFQAAATLDMTSGRGMSDDEILSINVDLDDLDSDEE